VNRLKANRPDLQKTFPGTIGLLYGKDRIPLQHSAMHLARERVGPALRGKDTRLEQGVGDGFGGNERIGDNPAEEIALAGDAKLGCRLVSLGTK
jgi:hypothetical protein